MKKSLAVSIDRKRCSADERDERNTRRRLAKRHDRRACVAKLGFQHQAGTAHADLCGQHTESTRGRADVAVTAQCSLDADGRLEKMVVVYPSTRGPLCDDLKVAFKYDQATDNFVADGPSFRWMLRATKP
jgi:hypothetical protein